MKNPILDEIRRFREEYAAKFNYDITRMLDESQRRERQWGLDLVSVSPTGDVTIVYKAPREMSDQEFWENALRVMAESNERIANQCNPSLAE